MTDAKNRRQHEPAPPLTSTRRCDWSAATCYGEAWNDAEPGHQSPKSGHPARDQRSDYQSTAVPVMTTVADCNRSVISCAGRRFRPGTTLPDKPSPPQQQLRGLRPCRHLAGEKEKSR